MKLSEVRKEAREALTGKWGKGACIVLAFLLIQFVFSAIANLFGEESLLNSIVSLIQAIIAVPLTFGLIFAFLKLKRDEEVSAFDFWKIGMENFSRSWRIAGRTILKTLLPGIILLISFTMFGGAIAYSTAATILATEVAVPYTFMAALVILCIIAIIYFESVSLLYLLTSHVAYDNKDMTALEVVNESARLMKGNRWKAILLDLSFIGWMILGIFTLGIGFLWLVPYIQVARVCFYEKLVQTNNGSENEPVQE